MAESHRRAPGRSLRTRHADSADGTALPSRRLEEAAGLGAGVALLRPCATSAGFTATPEPGARIDMARLKARLLAAGYQVVIDARIILIVRKGVESSCYDTGKVLVKTTDRDAAQSAYAELEPHVAASRRTG